MRIGILKTLWYYPFFPFYRAFFHELGMEVVLSPSMSSQAYHRERRQFVGDICLPVESAFCHAELLKKEVDILFVPRSNSIHKDAYVCPVCAGLPYVIGSLISDLPPLLRINLTPFRLPDKSARRDLAALGFGARDVKRAYSSACTEYALFLKKAKCEPDLDQVFRSTEGECLPPSTSQQLEGKHHILLLGMPYVLGDTFLSGGIQEMLTSRGYRLSTPMMWAADMANREAVVEGYPIYWTFAGMSVAALDRAFRHGHLDGVIYCSSFACGVDSNIVAIVQSACKRSLSIPFCNLVFDEHMERSHVEVRVEAFLDCVSAHTKKYEE